MKSGDRVRPGAPLMQIDPRRQQAAVSSQEAERAAREANVAYAQQQQQRASELLAAGAISKQELEQAETALRDRARPRSGAPGAGPAAAGAAALLHRRRADGRHRRRRAGARRHAGVRRRRVLTTIDQNETLEVYVSVPIERAGDLKNGLPIQVLSSDGGQSWRRRPSTSSRRAWTTRRSRFS